LPLIFSCEYQTAGKQESDKWIDPHAVYLEGEPRKAMRAADLTSSGRFRMDRPWPDLLARLFETCKSTTLLVVGFATSKAKNIDVWERTIDLRGNTSPSESAAALVRDWRLQGWALEKKLERAGRSEVEGAALIAAVRPHVEAKVSESAGRLASGSADAWEKSANEYGPMMAAVARSLSPGFTTAEVRRRRQIEYARPDMRPRLVAREKTERRKRGQK
jgi:hypothetical protein